MGSLIAGLFGLLVLVGLVVLARRRSHRRGADDTLVTDLLGPPEAAGEPATQAGEEAVSSHVPHKARPPSGPQAGEQAEPSPSVSGPADEGDWLESQLAWITAWSQRMHQQIESAGQPEPDGKTER